MDNEKRNSKRNLQIALHTRVMWEAFKSTFINSELETFKSISEQCTKTYNKT